MLLSYILRGKKNESTNERKNEKREEFKNKPIEDRILLTEEEKNEYSQKHQKFIGFTVKECIDDFSKVSGRIPYSWEELFSAAQFGYTKALNAYDKSSGNKFTTLAFTCMKNEMIDHIMKIKNERYRQVGAYYKSIGRFDKIEEYENREHCPVMKEYYIDYNDVDSYEIDYTSVEVVDDKLMKELLSFLEENLNERGIFVLNNYFDLNMKKKKEMNQVEIAKELKVSQPTVSNYIKKIKKIATEFLTRKEIAIL